MAEQIVILGTAEGVVIDCDGADFGFSIVDPTDNVDAPLSMVIQDFRIQNTAVKFFHLK